MRRHVSTFTSGQTPEFKFQTRLPRIANRNIFLNTKSLSLRLIEIFDVCPRFGHQMLLIAEDLKRCPRLRSGVLGRTERYGCIERPFQG